MNCVFSSYLLCCFTLYADSSLLGCCKIDDSKSQEMIERKIKNAPEGQGTVRMIEREEWDEFREVRPRTPFESKLARPNAQIRTGEPVRKVKQKQNCLITQTKTKTVMLCLNFGFVSILIRMT